jgi:Uma2 family endonuclease
MSITLEKRRFTVDEYHRMAQAGVFSEDESVELLEGEIVEMTPISSRHAACVNKLTRLFGSELGERVVVSVQNPVALTQTSEPQPDMALLRPRPDFYAAGHPGPEDVLLIVEVADASATSDRAVKVPLYATAGLEEVWLVDLQKKTIEVYRLPSQAGYKQVLHLSGNDSLSPQAFPALKLITKEVLN